MVSDSKNITIFVIDCYGVCELCVDLYDVVMLCGASHSVDWRTKICIYHYYYFFKLVIFNNCNTIYNRSVISKIRNHTQYKHGNKNDKKAAYKIQNIRV